MTRITMSSRERGPSLNDADLWALTSACTLEAASRIDEEIVSFHTPFCECLEMADGNKEIARALYWQQFQHHSWRRLNVDTEV
jgi:hypothetical protein